MTERRIGLMEEAINSRLKPSYLEIIDDSAMHVGHFDANEKHGGHFTVIIGADAFKDKSTLACHRLVYEALDDLMHEEIHALSIQIKKS